MPSQEPSALPKSPIKAKNNIAQPQHDSATGNMPQIPYMNEHLISRSDVDATRTQSIADTIKDQVSKPTPLGVMVAREALSTTVHIAFSCLLNLILSALLWIFTFDWMTYNSIVGNEEHCNSGSGASLLIDGMMTHSQITDICPDQFKKSFMSTIIFESLGPIQALLRWSIAWLLPSKVLLLKAPGFVFSSPWLLYFIRDHFGPIPNVPTRISEMMLGRMSPRELVVILPVHFIGSVISAFILRVILSPFTFFLSDSIDVHPIVYSDRNPWLVDLTAEILVTAAFTVSILVLPELFKLNSIPRVFIPFAMYPIFSYSVDIQGMGSIFSPSAFYALQCVTRYEEVSFRQKSHLFGPVLGGVLGGYVMSVFFPDPPKEDVRN